MKHLIVLLLLCSLAAGCTVFRGVKTLVLEPAHYCHTADRAVTHHRAKRSARAVWHDLRAAGVVPPSRHYADGFRDGFIEYYLYGGDGTPPPLPPRKYWDIHDRDGGQQAAVDWFAGYAHGASAASFEVGHPTVPSAAVLAPVGMPLSPADACIAPEPEPIPELIPAPLAAPQLGVDP